MEEAVLGSQECGSLELVPLVIQGHRQTPISHVDFVRIIKKSQNSRTLRNKTNVINTKVLRLNYTHFSIQPLHMSRATRENMCIIQLLKNRKYFREMGKKKSDRAHECKSSVWTASP